MDKQHLIKYFKKQLYCPICSTKLDFKFDSRIDYIAGICNNKKLYNHTEPHQYYYNSNSYKYGKNFGFGIDVRIFKDKHHVQCDFDSAAESYQINVFTDEELNKENSSYWDRGIQYIAVPCITKEIYEPKEYYGFLSKIFKKLRVFE